MKHESFREMLALRLYGELESRDGATLEEHLKSCADCRAFADELESGLGAARRSQSAHGARDTDESPAAEIPAAEIPANWRERLRRSTIDERRHGRLSPLWSAAAAFAAGILVATVVAHRAGDQIVELVAQNDGPRGVSIYERFHGSTPPPQATTGGQLARLGEYWKH